MNFDQQFSIEHEHIIRQQPEVERQLSLIDDTLANLIVMHWHPTDLDKRAELGRLLLQQIEAQIVSEAAYRANEKLEDQE